MCVFLCMRVHWFEHIWSLDYAALWAGSYLHAALSPETDRVDIGGTHTHTHRGIRFSSQYSDQNAPPPSDTHFDTPLREGKRQEATEIDGCSTDVFKSRTCGDAG